MAHVFFTRMLSIGVPPEKIALSTVGTNFKIKQNQNDRQKVTARTVFKKQNVL